MKMDDFLSLVESGEQAELDLRSKIEARLQQSSTVAGPKKRKHSKEKPSPKKPKEKKHPKKEKKEKTKKNKKEKAANDMEKKMEKNVKEKIEKDNGSEKPEKDNSGKLEKDNNEKLKKNNNDKLEKDNNEKLKKNNNEKLEKDNNEKLEKNKKEKAEKTDKAHENPKEKCRTPSSVVVPVFPVMKPSRWEIEEGEPARDDAQENSKICSAVFRVTPSVTAPAERISCWPIDRTYSPPIHKRHQRPEPFTPRAWSRSNSRSDERRHSRIPSRRTYTGYDYSGRRSSPIRVPTEDEEAARRPSPPKDMPEHIRWLHERWSKYNKSFFTSGGKKEEKMEKKEPENAATSEIPLPPPREESTTSGITTTTIDHVTSSANEPIHARKEEKRTRDYHSRERERGQRREKYSMPYYQFRKGGVVHSFGDIFHRPVMALKEFIVSQPGNLANDEDEALRLYEGYKLEYKRRMFADFFQAHQEEEWFLEKYHPMFKAEREAGRREAVEKRLHVFMQLLVRGWMEARLDVEESRHLRKVLDGCIVLLEGGDETDLGALSDLDYILEEKKEEATELQRLEEEAKAKAALEAEEDEDEDDEEGKKAKKAKLCMDDEENGDEEQDPESLEIMQHAKDYSLYVKDHLKEQALDLSDEPDLLSLVQVKTKYVGEGMFVQELVPSTSNSDETTLHKVSAVLITNIPPFARRRDLEELCANSHGGYLRLFLSQPDPKSNFMRYAVASFWSNANVQKICWNLRGAKIGAYQLSVSEYRDFGQRRIAFIDGLAADKSIALRDIQLCKSLIEYLDKKHRLWEQPRGVGYDGVRPPTTNPLLLNLDECLAFQLQQLIDSGRLVSQSTKKSQVDPDPNLLKILDRLILYLRIVHSVDYYGCRFYETEDEEPKRIGLIHIRGPVLHIRPVSSRNLTTYIKDFETRLKDILPSEARLSSEHVELLGKRSYTEESDRYVRANIVAAHEQGMAQCCMCLKRFTSEEFARRHILERHSEKLEEIKWLCTCFNNYLSDPNRPCSLQGGIC